MTMTMIKENENPLLFLVLSLPLPFFVACGGILKLMICEYDKNDEDLIIFPVFCLFFLPSPPPGIDASLAVTIQIKDDAIATDNNV